MKKQSSLSAETREDLARSGITPEMAEKLGIRELPADDMYRLFKMRTTGYLIPYNEHYGRARFHDEIIRKGGSKQKYAQRRGSSPELYMPDGLAIDWEAIKRDVSKALLICEGEKKAIALNLSGYPTIGIGGVSCWGSRGMLLPQWDEFHLRGREVFIVYDSDIISKPQVQDAERGLASELTKRGARVMRIRLPETHKGADDFLVAHGFPTQIDKSRAAFDSLAKEPIDLTNIEARLTDIGNAALFVALHGETLRYVPDWKKWIVYDESTGTWKLDSDGMIMRLAKATVMKRYDSLNLIKDDREKADRLRKAIRRLENTVRLKAMIELAQSEPGISISVSELDRNRLVIGLGNGLVYDLSLGSVYPASPEDYLTKSVGAVYDPSARCPRWERFLIEIFPGQNDLIQYVQKAAGYSLTGETKEQCFFVLNGHGANGKSTFLNVMLTLFGDYGMQAQPETFMQQRNKGGARSDIARLMSARLISTSEVGADDRLDEPFIKQWTGGDVITSRFMYQEHFQAQAQGKIWLATNHKPRIRGTDHGIWRRVHIVPFIATFEPAQQDLKLLETLLGELSGILNWALEGCRMWLEVSLLPPAIVTSATDSYREEVDTLGLWITECCIQDPKEHALASLLYHSYTEWAGLAGERFPLTRKDFTRHMEERGFSKQQTTDSRQGRIKGWFLNGIILQVMPKFLE